MKLRSALFLLVGLGISLAIAQQDARSQGLAASPDESINIDDADSPISDFSGQEESLSDDDEDTPKVGGKVVSPSTSPPPKRTHQDQADVGSGGSFDGTDDGEDPEETENGNDFGETDPIDQLPPQKPIEKETDNENFEQDITTSSTSSTKTPPSEIKGPAPNREVSVQPANRQNKLLGITSHPGILAGIIGGAVVGLLCAILLIMFIVYRMRKKDEGSYALDEPKRASPAHRYGYSPAPTKEFYA